MKKIVVGAAMMLMGGAAAQAQDMAPYAGVGIGAFGLEYQEPGLNQKNTVFGGYGKFGIDVNDYFGVELRLGATTKGSKSYAVGSLGSAVPFSLSFKDDYFLSYLAKLQYPASQDFRVYAMLGATSASIKRTSGALGINDSAKKTAFSYGVGADFNVTEQISAGAEWMQYWNNVTVGSGIKMKMWGAVGTASFHF
ncbi:porin family protein [Mariprofundus erugo]|uniref:Porin family protein n=1 Tax=Mariprofundus erugo TaxID=2528639 RepID=A0A5R9GQJ0_9PROT|nr:porin family protein [Mariprofundus erugo]TLS67199.1 porin family protein [Mariprofundus erugo]TLS73577.1 porin family protein [Mariprofundus erugo]